MFDEKKFQDQLYRCHSSQASEAHDVAFLFTQEQFVQNTSTMNIDSKFILQFPIAM